MAVISLTIIESKEQILAGVPKYVTITTNIPSTIFYTTDGSDPTIDSDIYTTPVLLPINSLVTLKVFATNGIDSSQIITEEFSTNILANTRLSHSATNGQNNANESLYPLGTNTTQLDIQYFNPAESGINVFDPSLPSVSNGFDSEGNPNNFTNENFNSTNYQIIKTERNDQNQRLPVGSLPKVTIQNPPPPPTTTNQFKSKFDPRALVIFQNVGDEDPTSPPQINRQFFSLEDKTKTRDGAYLHTSGLDAPPLYGSLVNSYLNPRTNEMTTYYFDSVANRWLISKAPYSPSQNWDGNMAGFIAGGRTKSINVFKWRPFAQRFNF